VAQVFISYKSSERNEVAKIAVGLQGSGFTVWWDHALLGGQDYSTVIDREIAAAKVVMPIWSKESIKSRWVSAEAERGWDKLFPVRIDDVQPPLPYNKLHTLDLQGWSGDADDPRWQRLVADLQAIVSGKGRHSLQSLAPLGKRANIGRYVAWFVAPVAAVATLAVLALQNVDALRTLGQRAEVEAVAPAAAQEAANQTQAIVAAPQATTAPSVPVRGAGERGIEVRTFPEALSVLRQSGGQVSLQICQTSTARCGLTEVRVGDEITIRVSSQISGRLILLDENARGEQTQIFPNGLSSSGAGLTVAAGQVVQLPMSSHGFVFGVSEPIGPSRLVAMVLPEAAPLPSIVVENTTERGIAAIPANRRDEFANTIAQALPEDGERTAVALGELRYHVATPR